MKFIKYILMIAILATYSCSQNPDSDRPEQDINNGPRIVDLRENDLSQYRLFVNDEEFYVHGAGLEFGNQESLADHGANSFRTWRTDNGQLVLDQAESLGLMVLMGIEVGRERHGYDYNDAEWVALQKEEIKKQVMQYKDHPALLGWGIGNELNLRYTNNKVWDAVNDISIMIHEIDGNHPTTTMLAGISKKEIDYINKNCTDLDFISIQMYGDIINLQDRIQEAGYTGPYMVTEWGATGHWEVPTTDWGAPIEESSTQKAVSIRERYINAIQIDDKNCLGSYVFLWGQKQERTPTWYGLFTEDHEETAAIEEIHYFWNGLTYPENRVPKITEPKLLGKTAVESIKVDVNSELVLTYSAIDSDNDVMTSRIEVLPEATDLGDGGDHESRPQSIDGLLIDKSEGKITFSAPDIPGAYRVFLYVADGQGHAATINIPFYVND